MVIQVRERPVFFPLIYRSFSISPYGVGTYLYGVSTLADTAIHLPASTPCWGGFKLSLSLYIQLDRVEYSDTSCMNIDDLSSKSLWGVSNSAILPSLRTRTRSLSITVGIRCAMVQTVQSLNSLRMIF
uniref:Uncharacterized protein n=1 Tax=Arundo donax TaxID=35708 RepID=A0A0A9EBS6_ARUDO